MLLLFTQQIQAWNIRLPCSHWLWRLCQLIGIWSGMLHVYNDRCQKAQGYLNRLLAHKCLFDNLGSWIWRRFPFYTQPLFHVYLSWICITELNCYQWTQTTPGNRFSSWIGLGIDTLTSLLSWESVSFLSFNCQNVFQATYESGARETALPEKV